MKTNSLVMESNQRNTLLLQLSAMYAEHVFIDLTADAQNLNHLGQNTTSAALTQHCLPMVKLWIEQNLGLPCDQAFPYEGKSEHDRQVSELVNGFALWIDRAKVIFIPSQNLDIAACEIPQEWVDLPNWAGDYYVPIQVDVEMQFLHLWGMISHHQLKQAAHLDSLFRYYHVAANRLVADLDVLWTSCELTPAPRSTSMPTLAAMGQNVVTTCIERVVSQALPNFPRLILPFSEWGAILNQALSLEQYLAAARSRSIVTILSQLLTKPVNTLYQQWETIENFMNPPMLQTAFRGARSNVEQLIQGKSYRGLSLETPEEIEWAITQLYQGQTELTLSSSPVSTEDLVVLMEKSTNETIRWKATEYLWVINPHHAKLPVRRIRDLGIQFATDSLALMISQLPVAGDRRAILLRIYPISRDVYLPAGVNLSVLDEWGKPILISANQPFAAISRAEPPDNYIQLYFVADIGDQFGVCVTLKEQKFVEHFLV